MGWWESDDGTVIGDGLADIADGHLNSLAADLTKAYPAISIDQILNTIAFCSGHLGNLDDCEYKVLVVMTIEQRKNWRRRNKSPSNMNIRIAPGTSLRNVFSPFTGEVV